MNMNNGINFTRQVPGTVFSGETTKSTNNIGSEMKNQAINGKHAVAEISANGGQAARNLDSAEKMKLGGLVQEINSRLSQNPAQPAASTRALPPTPARAQQPAAPPTRALPAIPRALPAIPTGVASKQVMEATEKTTRMTNQLDSALAIASHTGNNAILKYTIQETEKDLNHLATVGLNPRVVANFKIKLDECKQMKSALPSERKQVMQAIMNDLMQDVTGNNKALAEGIEAQFKLQKEGLKKNEDHVMEINGHRFIISKDSQAAKGTTIPAIWKREAEPFAAGAMSAVYMGNWVTNPRNMADLAVKERFEVDQVGPRNEVIVTQMVHADGIEPGVIRPPKLVEYQGKLVVLMDLKGGDGLDLGRINPAMHLSTDELKNIVLTAKNGLAAIHNKAQSVHSDLKAENLLWDGGSKTLMIADLEGARRFDLLFLLDQFPSTRDVLGHYTLKAPGLEAKIDQILQANKNAYEQANSPLTKYLALKSLMKELVPVLKANDEYTLGLALCESLMPSFIHPNDESQSGLLNNIGDVADQLEKAKIPREVATEITRYMYKAGQALYL